MSAKFECKWKPKNFLWLLRGLILGSLLKRHLSQVKTATPQSRAGGRNIAQIRPKNSKLASYLRMRSCFKKKERECHGGSTKGGRGDIARCSLHLGKKENKKKKTITRLGFVDCNLFGTLQDKHLKKSLYVQYLNTSMHNFSLSICF